MSSLRLIRIFLSSPGDMADERALACTIADDLTADPLLRDRVVVRSVAWDQLSSRTPMLATLTPQEAINRRLPRPSECDIMVVLLWSRMGTPLPFPDYKKDDGTPYQSGTEWEYLDAVSGAKTHAHGLPLVAVYRRTEEPTIKLSDPQRAEKIEQWEQVQTFFAQFTGPDGAIRGGYNPYESPEDFRRLFEHDIRDLIDTVLHVPTDAPPPPPPVEETIWPGSPFPGLRAFTPADAPIFFGRGRETDALIQRVKDSRFVAVVGASGSGKSSLVGAGLIPRLKDNAISGEHLGSKDWRVVSFKPGEKEGDPFRALADALVVTFPSLIPSPLEAKRLKDEFVAALKADPTSLADTIAAALTHDPAWAEVLLFVDQFEELFTVVQPDLRTPFVDLLNKAAGAARLRTVVTMRADFYHRCVDYPPLAEMLRAGSFPLAAPERPALYEMITRPAVRAGLEFENDLAWRILDDTGSEPGNLALMAYTLDELYQACCRTATGLLSHAAYNDLGGVPGAIGTRAENVFAGLDAEAQSMLPTVFRYLVSVTVEGTPTRRRAVLAPMMANDAAGRLIAALTDARLLVQSEGEMHQALVEVAHEALFRSWPTLVKWIASTKDDLYLLQQVQHAAREWNEHGRIPAYLWPDERLKPVYVMVQQLQPDLDPVAQDFIRPEADRLLAELDDIDTPHARRSAIGERLCAIGDSRPGVGLRPDGLPDIVWCEVPDGKIEIKDKTFTVQPFYVAKYPITFRQFQAFLDDPDGFERDDWWDGLTEEYRKQEMDEQRFKFANHPRETVSWYQSVAFCRWLSARLPAEAWPDTAALGDAVTPRGGSGRLLGRTQDAVKWEIRLPAEWEWQYAATGGHPANEYPWGPEWDGRRCNTTESGLSRTTAVGMYPHGAATCGALDMSGNVREWCLNEYEKPANAGTGDARRVLRGGAWRSPLDFVRCVYRDYDYPSFGYGYVGFRVVCASPI